MKQYSMKVTGIVVAICIVALVVIGILVNQHVSTGSDDENEPTEAQKPFAIFDDDFQRLTLKGEHDSVTLDRDESGQWMALDAEETVDQGKIDQLMSVVTSLSGIPDDTVSKDRAGVTHAQREISMTDDQGEENTLLIGDPTEDGSAYYGAYSNSDAIFMLDPALIEALPVQLEDLYDRSLVKLTAKQVNNITIDNGVQIIELSPDKPYSEEEVRTNLSGWYMHQPYQHVYSMQYDQMEAMLTGIEALEWVDTITENERDLAEYGLEDPDFTISFRNNDQEETILIGDRATGDAYYAKLKDEDTIVTIHSENLHPYSLEAFNLVEKFVKIIAVDVLETLEIEINGDEPIVVSVEHHETDEDATFSIDERTVEDQTFRDLYKTIAGLSFSEEVTDAVYEKPDTMMTYTISDEQTETKDITVEFVDYDADHYAVFIDQKADFIMEKADFTKMIDEIREQK